MFCDSQSWEGQAVMTWDETHTRIIMISTGQETFNFEVQICLAPSMWVLSSGFEQEGWKGPTFSTMHRKSPNNLAGRELSWYKDTEVQVSHSNQVSLGSGPLGSLLAHLDQSLFYPLPLLNKGLLLDRKLAYFYKTNCDNKDLTFCKENIFTGSFPNHINKNLHVAFSIWWRASETSLHLGCFFCFLVGLDGVAESNSRDQPGQTGHMGPAN